MYHFLLQELKKHFEEKGPVKIGIAGTGFIGGGVLAQISRMKGPFYRAMVVYYHTEKGFMNAMNQCESNMEYEFCDTESEVQECISKDKIAAVTNLDLMFSAPLDVIMDMTGEVVIGAELAYKAIMNGVSMMASPETDIALGHSLNQMAKKNHVVYSGFSGDEPGEIMNLICYVKLMNFEIVGAGKFKNFHDPYANPTSVKKWADLYGQNPYKLASFADGTKMNMEMGITANATGLIPDVKGMHCPEGTLETVTSLICPIQDGGILNQTGVLEVVRGVEPSGGIFVVGRTENPKAVSDLTYLKMGKGPYYLFYKPYHLCQFEMLLGAAKVAILKDPVLQPMDHKVVEVVPYAKKDLKAGEVIDKIGGYAFYGLIEERKTIDEKNFVPVSALPGTVAACDIKKDERITRRKIIADQQGYMWKILNHQI